MEMEGKTWEKREEEEEEATSLLVRKTRIVESPTEVEVEVSNGTNGHAPENGVEKEEESTPDEDEGQVEEVGDGVVEKEAETRNGKEKPAGNLVYYDKHEGVDSASADSGGTQIVKDPGYDKLSDSSPDVAVPNGSISALTNGKDGEEHYVSSSKLQTSEITSDEQTADYKSSKDIESENIELINEDDVEETDYDVEKVIKKQNTHDLYCPNCNSCITRRVILRKRKRRVRLSDEEVKRNKIEAVVDSKSGTLDSQVHHVNEDGAGELTVEDEERGRGPEVFRCLSCFSIFIPTGNGFKLFRIFGEKSEKNKVGDEQASTTTKQSWFTSMFASKKQDTRVGQGSRDAGVPTSISGDEIRQPLLTGKPRVPEEASERVTETSQKNDKVESRNDNLALPRPEPAVLGKGVIGSGDNVNGKTAAKIDATKKQYEGYINDQFVESKSGTEVQVNGQGDLSLASPPKKPQFTNGEPADDTKGGLKLLISSNNEVSPILDNSVGALAPNKALQFGDTDKEDSQLLPTSVSVISDADNKLNISVSIPHQDQHFGATFLTQSTLENKNSDFGNNGNGQVHPDEFQNVITKTKVEVLTRDSLKVDSISSVQEKDTIITIDAQPAVSSQTAINIPAETSGALQSTTQLAVADRGRAERRKVLGIEVIKSIVYGGLAESVTSLSVVTSAAGGNAATLNIIALGVANLIGGLFIICHNLWELKSDRAETQLTNQITEQRDRYRELLGRRENFILHAFVSITSYIISGLVPPVVYSFSFRKSDDKEFKLIAVAVASFVCIFVLAIGRAYVQRPPKAYLKSVVTFLILGFMVSGVSYAAGILVERLLEKFGLFRSGSGSAHPYFHLPEMTSTGSSWSSY